jgi:hypothetical protein
MVATQVLTVGLGKVLNQDNSTNNNNNKNLFEFYNSKESKRV